MENSKIDFLLMDQFMCGGFAFSPIPDIKTVAVDVLTECVEIYNIKLKTIKKRDSTELYDRGVVKTECGIEIDTTCVFNFLDQCIDMFMIFKKKGLEFTLSYKDEDFETYGKKALTAKMRKDFCNIFDKLYAA